MKSKEKTDLLIRDYFDGRISQADLGELENVLASSSAVRKQFRLAATIEEGLSDYAINSVNPMTGRAYDVELPASNGMNWFSRAAAFGLALGALIAGIGLFTFLRQDESLGSKTSEFVQIPESVDEETPVPTYVAFLVDEVNAQFEDLVLEPTLGFKKGDYVLTSGSIHLRFGNGADMVLDSPARFTILDDMNFQLHDGSMRAIFPPTARGFQVESPGAAFKDHGTEMGIYADSLENKSELYVFHGRVESMGNSAAGKTVSFDSGEAVVYRNGVLESGDFTRSNFLKPGSLV